MPPTSSAALMPVHREDMRPVEFAYRGDVDAHLALLNCSVWLQRGIDNGEPAQYPLRTKSFFQDVAASGLPQEADPLLAVGRNGPELSAALLGR